MHSVTDMLVLDVEERVMENTRTSELNQCGDGAATQLHIYVIRAVEGLSSRHE